MAPSAPAPPVLPSFKDASAAIPEPIARAADLWLARYGPHTRRRYATEWRRFVLWVHATRPRAGLPGPGLPDSGFRWEDPDYGAVADYAVFLSRPPKTWCGHRYPQDHPRWRPLTGPLDAATVAQAITALSSFYAWAVKEGSIYRNPFALWRERQPVANRPEAADAIRPPARRESFDVRAARVARRALSERELAALSEAIASLPANTDPERFVRERARMIFDLGLLLGLRIGEIAYSRMRDLTRVRLGETTGWFWYGVGKGGQEAGIPVPDALLDDLARYRETLGLPSRPEPGEDTPLLRRTCTGIAGLSVRHTRQIFYDMAARAAAVNPDQEIQNALESASPHWLRHTYVTRLIERNEGVVDLDTVRNARHARIDTTLIYAHSDRKRRYESVKYLSWAANPNHRS